MHCRGDCWAVNVGGGGNTGVVTACGGGIASPAAWAHPATRWPSGIDRAFLFVRWVFYDGWCAPRP